MIVDPCGALCYSCKQLMDVKCVSAYHKVCPTNKRLNDSTNKQSVSPRAQALNIKQFLAQRLNA